MYVPWVKLELKMLVSKRPALTLSEAEALALEHYDLNAKAKELPSERDQNFRLDTLTGDSFLLKIAHPDETEENLDFQAKALSLLTAPHYPSLCHSIEGEALLRISSSGGEEHFLRLLTYLPGQPVAERERLSINLLESIGRTLGEMDNTLASFSHPAMHRHLPWNSEHAPTIIRSNLSYIADPSKRELVSYYLDTFATHVSPHSNVLRQSVIHNDVNDYNLLVEDDAVTGIIDFGDMVRSYTVCELANACAYLMLNKNKPLDTIFPIVKSYDEVYPLQTGELEVLFDFIYLRLCLSVSMSAKQQHQNPDNRYLSISEGPAWALLETLASASAAQYREQLSTTLSD